MFQDCFLYYSASFDDIIVSCTPTVVADRQSYMAAMTVNYIKACKEFNLQLPLKLPVEPPLGQSTIHVRKSCCARPAQTHTTEITM